jgi:hypothetical protein
MKAENAVQHLSAQRPVLEPAQLWPKIVGKVFVWLQRYLVKGLALGAVK